jgi:hypothetical protein
VGLERRAHHRVGIVSTFAQKRPIHVEHRLTSEKFLRAEEGQMHAS